MKNVIPITEARKRIFDIIDDVARIGKHFIITDKGRAKAVLMSAEEFDSWQETLEVMKDFPDLSKDIKEAKRDLKTGVYKTYPTLEEVLAEQGFIVADKAKSKYGLPDKTQAKRKKTTK